MSAQAIFAVSRGLEAASGINSAFQEQAYAQLQEGLIQKQMDEINTRTNMQIAQINKEAEKFTAKQEVGFISGGVELTGTPMNVISDSLNDAAQAAYIRRREADYDLMGLAMDKSQYHRMASNETLILKAATATIGATAGYAADKAMYGKGAGKTRSANGIGDTTPGNGLKDAFGGDTQESLDYMKMKD
jgi:hypothetical protein